MAKSAGEKKLTEKQENILEFIKERTLGDGFPPTVREVGDRFNITVKGAYDHIKAIEKKGFIRTEQNKSRAIVVINQESDSPPEADSLQVPLLGRIAAGAPILAQEHIEEYLSFPKSMLGKGEFFALNIKGDSMIEGGIYDGDIAVIKQQNTAQNGDIVAALLEEEATLKKFKKTGSEVQLIPQNSAYKPIVTNNVMILGTLAAIFRRY